MSVEDKLVAIRRVSAIHILQRPEHSSSTLPPLGALPSDMISILPAIMDEDSESSESTKQSKTDSKTNKKTQSLFTQSNKVKPTTKENDQTRTQSLPASQVLKRHAKHEKIIEELNSNSVPLTNHSSEEAILIHENDDHNYNKHEK